MPLHLIHKLNSKRDRQKAQMQKDSIILFGRNLDQSTKSSSQEYINLFLDLEPGGQKFDKHSL